MFTINNQLKAAGTHLLDHVVPHERNAYRPHLLKHRALFLFSVLLVTIKIFGVVVLGLVGSSRVFAAEINQANIISLTNQSRTQNGLKELTYSSLLEKAAKAKALDMLSKQYFAHNTPDNRTPWDFIHESGYKYLAAGENLAIDFTEAEKVSDAWMNSPGHRANILNKYFTEIGVASVTGRFQGHDSIIVVQMFGLPVSSIVNNLDKGKQVASVTVSDKPALVLNSEAESIDEKNPESHVPYPANLRLLSSEFVFDKEKNLVITAKTTTRASQVVAVLGSQKAVLDLDTNFTWRGKLDLPDTSTLTDGNNLLSIQVYDFEGVKVSEQVVSVSPSFEAGVVQGHTPQKFLLNILGANFDLTGIVSNSYPIFLVVILSSLMIAIAFKRHVQHLDMIAHTAVVAIAASLIWAM